MGHGKHIRRLGYHIGSICWVKKVVKRTATSELQADSGPNALIGNHENEDDPESPTQGRRHRPGYSEVLITRQSAKHASCISGSCALHCETIHLHVMPHSHRSGTRSIHGIASRFRSRQGAQSFETQILAPRIETTEGVRASNARSQEGRLGG